MGRWDVNSWAHYTAGTTTIVGWGFGDDRWEVLLLLTADVAKGTPTRRRLPCL
jgi:hypothetical protein